MLFIVDLQCAYSGTRSSFEITPLFKKRGTGGLLNDLDKGLGTKNASSSVPVTYGL